MANHKSSKKCIRKIARRTEINKARVSRIRTYVKKFENHLCQPSVNLELAHESLILAEKELRRGVTKGVLHRNTVSRKISRLTHRLKSITE